jgi:hypothetical protein
MMEPVGCGCRDLPAGFDEMLGIVIESLAADKGNGTAIDVARSLLGSKRHQLSLGLQKGLMALEPTLFAWRKCFQTC